MVFDKITRQAVSTAAPVAKKYSAFGAGIDDEEYFHGFLEKEDVTNMLERPGEFLVRITENEKGQRILVLSVRRSNCDSSEEEALKHFMIVQDTRKPTRFRIDKKWFPTVQHLIHHHVSTRTPVCTQIPDAILVQGVFRQQWEVSHDDLQTVLKIGEGTFGEVYFGYMRTCGKKRRQCVIKIAKNQGNSKANVKEIMKEARVMRNFDHPNVVRMFGVAIEREPLALVMEFVDGGSLDSYLRKTAIISCAEKEKMAADAAWGIEYLHYCHFLHRDIASRNCLYSKLKILKIADFGLSREGPEYHMKSPQKLPLKWLSPETLEQGIHTMKSDVYSYGILVWEIFANAATPFANVPLNQTTQTILQGSRPEFPDCTPSGIKELITKSCWAPNPKDRLTMQEVAVELEQITKNQPPYFQYKLRENAIGNNNAVAEEENLDASDKKVKKGSKEKEKEKEFLTQYAAITKKMGPPKKVVKEPSLDGSTKKIKKKKGDSTDLDGSAKNKRRKSAPSPAVTAKDESVPEENSLRRQDSPKGFRKKKTSDQISKVLITTKVPPAPAPVNK